MQNNIANPIRTSNAVNSENKDLYDLRSQLKIAVESEWAKRKTNMFEKKKQKSRNAKPPRHMLPRVVINFNQLTCYMIFI